MSGKPRLTAKQKREMKSKICEILGKTPIIETACRRVGISRMTFCRWRKDDPKFSQELESVLEVSRESLCDLAESKMIQLISEGHASMIRFCLKNNSPRYKKNPENTYHNYFLPNSNTDPDYFKALMKAFPKITKTNTSKK